jgi:hypothetical protein
MSLLGGFVALADQLTKSFGLQASVRYFQYTGQDGAGKPTYADAAGTVRQAIVEQKIKQVRTFDGTLGTSTASVTFLDPTVVSEFDKIVFMDGRTQPIIGTSAFQDDTNAGVLTEIFLG